MARSAVGSPAKRSNNHGRAWPLTTDRGRAKDNGNDDQERAPKNEGKDNFLGTTGTDRVWEFRKLEIKKFTKKLNQPTATTNHQPKPATWPVLWRLGSRRF